MDEIIRETLKIEQDHGIYAFLLPYAQSRPFLMQPARSQFLDGEIALMLACRRIVAEKQDYKLMHRERIRIMLQRM